MANLVKSNRALSPLRDFFNVDDFFDGGWLNKWQKDYPAVNISEDEKIYAVEVIAPGFRKDDFKLKVEDDLLTISAETKSEKKEPRTAGSLHAGNIAIARLPVVSVCQTM